MLHKYVYFSRDQRHGGTGCCDGSGVKRNEELKNAKGKYAITIIVLGG